MYKLICVIQIEIFWWNFRKYVFYIILIFLIEKFTLRNQTIVLKQTIETESSKPRNEQNDIAARSEKN